MTAQSLMVCLRKPTRNTQIAPLLAARSQPLYASHTVINGMPVPAVSRLLNQRGIKMTLGKKARHFYLSPTAQSVMTRKREHDHILRFRHVPRHRRHKRCAWQAPLAPGLSTTGQKLQFLAKSCAQS